MTEQTKPTENSATQKTNGVAAAGNAAMDRERLVSEYEQSRDAWLRRPKLDLPPEMSEEEILDLAVELCRRPADG